MAETDTEYDPDRDRMMRFIKFAAILIGLMFFWYGFNIADGF